MGLSVNIELQGTMKLLLANGIRLSPETVLSRLFIMFGNHERWKDLTMNLRDAAACIIHENFPLGVHEYGWMERMQMGVQQNGPGGGWRKHMKACQLLNSSYNDEDLL